MMRRKLILGLMLCSVGCSSASKEDQKSIADEKRRPRSTTRPGPFIDKPEDFALPSDQDPLETISVRVSAGDEASPFAPRYSPPGKRLELKPISVSESLGIDGLEAEILLGWPIEKQKPIKLLVTRPASEEAYNKLFIDANCNGVFDEEPILAKGSESRGNTWSNFLATIKATYLTDEPFTEDYPVAFWIAVASKAERPEFIRVSRRGFKSGEVIIGEQKATLILSDSNNDAVYEGGDWWELRAADKTDKGEGSRKVGDFQWFGETAYKLILNDATGNSGRLERVELGKTREQDELDRDPYGADKRAAKAEKPVEFRQDAEDAITDAAAMHKRCFIKFETTWCGPCKTMAQYVFTAKEVVEASQEIVCVKVDGDEKGDLANRFAVKAYPTGILLAADGTEISRFVGYQKVVEMSRFLKQTPKSGE